MKELSKEEKAKAYDRVSKEVKDFFEGKQKMYSDVEQTLEYLFPELKESSDEKIRKLCEVLIRTCFTNELCTKEEKDDCIAWLEKQCKKKLAEKYNITGIKSKHAEGKLGEMIKEMKSTDEVKPKFKVGDVVINKKSKDTVKIVQILHDSYCYSGWDGAATVHSDFSISEQNNWELVELKPADKVEPKFKVGDIITNGKIIGKVDENENNKYHGWFGYNKDLSVHYADIPDVENWHLWTIQDAKDGDVLVCPKYAGDVIPNIFIFKCVKVKDNSVYSHCSFLKTFETGGYIASADPIDNDFYPATKEQHDTLMKAMADAGYEWDAKKKELNKRASKPSLRTCTKTRVNLIMEAPKKLYLSQIIYGTYQYQVPDPDDDTQVEYVRKDALVDKVCEWLDINIADYLNVSKSGTLTANMSQLFEDLKKHMEDNL